MGALSGDILDEQCFRYEYNHRGRMIMKKVPGAGEIYMVYDQWDRLVLMQDANMRGQHKWLFYKYDALNRPVMTGSYVNNTYTTLADMQNYLNSQNLGRYEQHIPDGALPMYSMNQTFPIITYNDVLKVTYYDDYAWTNGVPADFRTFDNGYNSYLYTPDDNNFPYPQAVVNSENTRGLVTGTITKALDGSTAMVTTRFYDDKARVIQTKSENVLAGCDILTTQYSFNGQPLMTVMRQQKPGANAQNSIIVTRLSYDDLWRVVKTEKKVRHNLVNSDAMPEDWTVVSELEYDKLGQIKTKKIGSKKGGNGAYTGDPIEIQTHSFNIRGWTLGLNREEELTSNGQGTRYFSFELGYDKLTNAGGRNFTTARYDGNISGMIWKSYGDGIRRKYDYHYDNSRRMMKALFEQNDQGSTWGKDQVDLSVLMGENGENPELAYDANGNIKRMQQWGLKVTGPDKIDDLEYLYYNNSNKLKKVTDYAAGGTPPSGPGPVLGDFSDRNTLSDDYGYDLNGNLVTDLNKRINGTTGEYITTGGAITYNHLNLPEVISFKKDDGTDKGSITYVYDASGNKLKKITVDESIAGKEIVTTITYIGGFVYESRATTPADTDNPDYTDVLKFISHEEGRIRFTEAAGTTPAKLHYDYFLKDYLGNVRMVLTEEQQQDVYPAATLEGSITNPSDAVFIENQFFSIDQNNIVNKHVSMPDYLNKNGGPNAMDPPVNNNPNSNVTANSQMVYKLQASTGGGSTGLGFALKVMAGDKVDIWGKSYYLQNNAGGNNYNVPLLGILDGFLNAPSGVAGGKTTSAELNGLTVLTSALSNFLSDPDRNNGGASTVPKAYINYILLDENFRYKGGGFSRVDENPNVVKDHYLVDASVQNIQVTQNGYIYVYVSNESPVEVFFDNLQVIHTRGPVLEETHYYPFGLSMAGISSKALKPNYAENKSKFNGGNELQSKEFSDGSGLEMYDAMFRRYDPQIGRWHQIDPLIELGEDVSPYAFADNNPLSFNDPLGLSAQGYIYDSTNRTITYDPDVHSQDDIKPNSGLAYLGERIVTIDADNNRTWWDENGNSSTTNPGWGNLAPVTVTGKRQSGSKLLSLLLGFGNTFMPTGPRQEGIMGTPFTSWDVERLVFAGEIIGLGLPLLPKRFSPSGATKRTSIASIVLRERIPEKWTVKGTLGKRIGGAVARRLGTNGLGAAAGRSVPIIGWGIFLGDIHQIVNEVLEGYIEEEKRNMIRDSPIKSTLPSQQPSAGSANSML